MPLVLDSRTLAGVVADLRRSDERLAADAEAAIDSLLLWESDDEPLVLTRRRLQLFLWYELPQKWLMPADELVSVAQALGKLLERAAPETAAYAALCRGAETENIIRAGGEGCFELIDSLGVEPPDTDVLEWSDLMTVEEAEEREAAAVFLEEAIDQGQLDPAVAGWRKVQGELLDGYLTAPSGPGSETPLDRIRAARIEAWLGPSGIPDGLGGERRTTLEPALPLLAKPGPENAEAAAAIEPLLWLLGLLADGARLTQTNALARAVVRAAVDRYPDWWQTELLGPAYRETEVVPLETLHSLVLALKLARRSKHALRLTTRGQVLRDDPAALFRLVVDELAAAGELFPTGLLDVGLATLIAGESREEVVVASWLLVAGLNRLLAPFAGVSGGLLDLIRITPAGRTLAVAILHARATGPCHTLF